MKTYEDLNGNRINVTYYFPFGWKIYVNGNWVANISDRDRLNRQLAHWGCVRLLPHSCNKK